MCCFYQAIPDGFDGRLMAPSRHRDAVEYRRDDVLGRYGDAMPALDAYSVTFALIILIEYSGLSPSFVGCSSIMRTP
jgi:hypothetical protein